MPDLSKAKKAIYQSGKPTQAAQQSKPKSPDTRLSIPLSQDLLNFITEQSEADLRSPARQAQFMLTAYADIMKGKPNDKN